MVGTPIKINPLDNQARRAIGISLVFSRSGVFNSTFSSRDAIKANLLNFLLTGQNERYFNPTFGAGITNFLFENITESELFILKESITDKVSVNFPNINIQNIELISNPDSNTINFRLVYSVRDTNILNEEINVDIQL